MNALIGKMGHLDVGALSAVKEDEENSLANEMKIMRLGH
jgi:hypothetical protein